MMAGVGRKYRAQLHKEGREGGTDKVQGKGSLAGKLQRGAMGRAILLDWPRASPGGSARTSKVEDEKLDQISRV